MPDLRGAGGVDAAQGFVPGRRMAGKGRRIGANWAFRVDEGGAFDELAVLHERRSWIHLERMDHRAWWMQLGSLRVDIYLRPGGAVDVLIEGSEYDVPGNIEFHARPRLAGPDGGEP